MEHLPCKCLAFNGIRLSVFGDIYISIINIACIPVEMSLKFSNNLTGNIHWESCLNWIGDRFVQNHDQIAVCTIPANQTSSQFENFVVICVGPPHNWLRCCVFVDLIRRMSSKTHTIQKVLDMAQNALRNDKFLLH